MSNANNTIRRIRVYAGKHGASAIGTIHAYKHGTAEIISFDGPWRREIYRPHVVADNEPWNREIRERCMAVGPDDAMPRHNSMCYGPGAGYDAKCSCCYLGITHSEALHARRVNSAA